MRTVFKTKDEVLEFLRSKDYLQESTIFPGVFWEIGIYVPYHGGHSKPDYLPSKYKDGWGVRRKVYHYDGPLCGRVDFYEYEYGDEILAL
jgi:hypothetical protein